MADLDDPLQVTVISKRARKKRVKKAKKVAKKINKHSRKTGHAQEYKKVNKMEEIKIPTFPKVANFKIPKRSIATLENEEVTGSIFNDSSTFEAPIESGSKQKKWFDSAGAYKPIRANKRHHSGNNSKLKVRCFDAAGAYNVNHFKPNKYSRRANSFPEQALPEEESSSADLSADLVNRTALSNMQMTAVMQRIQKFKEIETETEIIEKFNETSMFRYHSMVIKEFRFFSISIDSANESLCLTENHLPGNVDNYLSHFRDPRI